MTDNNKKTHLIVTGRGGGGSGEQVQADWNQSDNTQPDYIKNKPELATVATTGDYDDLQNKPTIPAAPVQSDWNESDTTSLAYINNKPAIPAAQVNSDWNANSGVAQILNKPTIPVVPPMDTETLTFTMQDNTTKTITFCTVRTGYFYVEDVSGSVNTLSITKSNADAPTIEVFKSTDQLNWESMGTTNTTAITATVPANGKLYLKATTNGWADNNSNNNHISCSGNHNVGGNSMSLLYGDNFDGKVTFPQNSGKLFTSLFMNDTHLKNAENLELPATAIGKDGYNAMFQNCTSLTTAPALPATTLGIACYGYMFQGCTSLTTAPVLPVTNVNQWSYRNMFDGCTALTTPPALPATTMGNNCYWEMFAGCTSLTTAPTLPATTVGSGCYKGMFNGCRLINQIITYADIISDNWSIRDWLSGVAATGDFYNLGSATYTADSASGIPTGWTEHNSL